MDLQLFPVYLVFYTRKHDEFSVMDSLFAFLWNLCSDCYVYPKKPYIHVEIGVNEYRNNFLVSYGINKEDKKIHRVPQKRFENAKMDPPKVLTLVVTKNDYQRILDFISKKRNENEPFDDTYYRYFLPVVGKCIIQKPKSWFCSKLTAHALRSTKDAIYIDPLLDIDHLTPQQLFDIIQPFCVNGLPSDVRPLTRIFEDDDDEE